MRLKRYRDHAVHLHTCRIWCFLTRSTAGEVNPIVGMARVRCEKWASDVSDHKSQRSTGNTSSSCLKWQNPCILRDLKRHLACSKRTGDNVITAEFFVRSGLISLSSSLERFTGRDLIVHKTKDAGYSLENSLYWA